MPRRTQTFIKSPWSGGLNTLIDPGMLPDNDLVTADNVVFTASGARVKREGMDQFDAVNNIPAVTHYASNATYTRTLTFASTLIPSGIQKLVRGEKITITSTNATLNTNYGGTFTIDDMPSATTITYTHTVNIGGSVGTTASSTFSVVRATPYVDVRDYWYLNSSYVKTQLVMAFSGQGKLFKFEPSTGNRTEITRPPEVSTVTVTNADSPNDSTNGDWFKLYDKAGSVGVYMKTGAADTPPTGLADRLIQVAYATGASTTTIATAIKTALDADSEFVATVNSTLVTITDAYPGARTNIADGTASGGSNPTGWTFATTTQGVSVSAPFTGSTAGITRTCSITLNERYILCPNDAPIYYYPTLNTSYYYDLAGSPPKSNSVSEHIGRLWMNDIENRDRLHYCTTGEPEEWQGVGDSGALDIGWGDGDPEGILAVSPSFKGRLFVGKATRLYQITGEEPLTFFPQPITAGLGVAGNKSFCAVEMDDLFFVSKEGMHSVSAVAAHGDYQSESLSVKIAPTFDGWPQQYLYRIAPIYMSPLNAVVFNVPEAGATVPSAFWLYDIEQKAWFNWTGWQPVATANFLTSSYDKKMLFSDSDGKLYKAENGDFTDSNGAGANISYRYKIKTGTIYVDGNPQTVKGYKNISFMFRPTGRYSFTLKVYIDNLPVQTKSFSQGISGDILGTTFMLGSSVLGSSLTFAPSTIPIEGYGRGISFQIENDVADEQVEMYGFIIEYESADISAEVIE